MRGSKRFLCFFLSFWLLTSQFAGHIHAETAAKPSISAQSAVVMDTTHGIVLYAKNADQVLPMASTTKIMTALVALEHSSPEAVISVSPEAVNVEGSSIYLCEGERLTLRELLLALLLESANDAAVAIAVAIGGSVEGFAALMNQAAARLGLSQTHFENPHGLHHEEHYTTARELAIITRAALENSLIAEIVSTKKATIPHNGKDGVRLLMNHNKLLRFYPDAVGVKTGFTKKSGRCLVSAARRGCVGLIAVTLNAPDDWSDHAALLDYGFSLMTEEQLCDPHDALRALPVVNGLETSVNVSNPEGCAVALPLSHGEITATVEAPRFLYAPIRAGETVGRVVYRCDLNGDGSKEILAEAVLTAQTHVPLQKKEKSLWKRLLEWLGIKTNHGSESSSLIHRKGIPQNG